jgi:hypothetical protein
MSETSETKTKLGKWRRILAHEMFEYLFNLAFLSFFLVSFAWYRRLLLASYDIEYTGYWAPLVEAAILAKVIMIGDALRVARGLRNWPLAVPAIYRTVMFSLLVVLFSIIEHVGNALFHGKKAADGIAELTSTGWEGLLAWYVLIIVAFLPFFTVKEIEAAFGPSKVRGLFFSRHRDEPHPPANDTGEATKSKP